MRAPFRILVRSAMQGLCLIAVLYGVAALAGSIPVGGAPKSTLNQPSVRIGLLQGPIHYDFLLPNDARLSPHLGWLSAHGVELSHPGANWLIVGWGARGFYTTAGTYSDIRPSAVLRALIGDGAVLRVDLAGWVTADAPVRWLDLTPAQYEALLRALAADFKEGSATQPLPLAGFTDQDRFFPAKGRFHALNTCNVWVGRKLRAAGLRFGLWTPTPFAITLSHKFAAS